MATKSFSYTISSAIQENSPFKQNLRNTSSAVPSDINSINIVDIKVTATAIVTDKLTLGLGFSSTNLTSYDLTYPDNKTATMTVTSSSSSWNSLISAVKNTGDVILYGSMTGQSKTKLTIDVVVNYTPVTSNTSDDTGVTTPRGIGSGTVPVVPGGGIGSGNVPVVSGGKVGTVVSDDVFFSSHNNVLWGWETASIGIVNNGQSYEPIKFKVTITVRGLPDGYNFYYGYTEDTTDENEVTNDNDGGNFTISFDINPSDDMDWDKYYTMYKNPGQVLNLYLLSQDFDTSVDVDVSVYFEKEVVWNLTDKSVTYSTSSQTVNIDTVTGVNGINYIVDLTNDLPPFRLNGTTLTIPAGTTAGTYKVPVTAIGFHDSEGRDITSDFNLVINKANAPIYFEPDDPWTYDGTSHSLGTVSYLGDGDVYYALTTIEGPFVQEKVEAAVYDYINYGGTFTKTHDGDTISTTNAGQYVFMAYSTEGTNYKASYSSTDPIYDGTFDVYKATPKFEGHNGIGKIIKDPRLGTLIPNVQGTVSASVEGTVHYGATTAMGSTKHVTPDAAVVVVTRNTKGTDTVYAWFEPTDKRNYNNVGSTTSGYITVTATVTAKEIPTVSFQNSTRTYNGSVQYEQFKSNVAGKLYRKADVALTSSNYTTGTVTTVAANTWTNCTQATYPGVLHMNYYFVPTDTSTYDNVIPDPHDFVMQKADDNFTFSPENITTTYSGTGQNVTITSATGAHGTLSYEVGSVIKLLGGYMCEYLGDNPTRGWEITSGTTLHIPANSVSNAGTYEVFVRATSAESSYYNETTKTANFYVDINKASIRPDTFTISPTSQTIYNVGKINFTITPSNSLGSVTYSSSNTSVANVSTEGNNTIVSYVGSGNCTITATDSGNSNYESATATCDVMCIKDYLDETKYKNTSGTSGYNIISYGTPNTPTLNTTYLTAAGGTIEVSGSTVINNISYYQKYHFQTNLYSDLQKGTNTGIVGYKITKQSYSPNSSGTPELGLGSPRFSISYETITHTTMDTDSGYDFVHVAAYNAGNTSKVSTPAKASVQNKVESISMDFDDNVINVHLIGAAQKHQIRYNNTAEVFVYAHYTSGSKADVSNSATITSADTTIIKVN